MKNKIIKMLELQDAMNTRINPEWRQAGNEWYRAIWIECAEMLDHYGWKWWKHQEPDMAQVILEIVDIWHFILSDLLETSGDTDDIASHIETIMQSSCETTDIPAAIEILAGNTLGHRHADVEAFVQLMLVADLTLDDLYRGYIGKNVLNFFRQDHGYKQGTYEKLWGGREDNEYLVETAADLDTDSPSFQQDLYEGLKAHYTRLCKQE
ncbi:MAG: dUTP diphosphatase [Gammaproteobacteria bacterium]|nr:dUTP diphosphatase [Gammaproteobacteria bacterium]